MRTNSKLHKIRIIVREYDRETYGVTIPETFKNWFNVFVSVQEENGRLILTSGAQPTPLSNKELKKMSIETTKVKI